MQSHETFIINRIKKLEKLKNEIFKDQKKPLDKRAFTNAMWHRVTGQIDILYIILTAHDNKYNDEYI